MYLGVPRFRTSYQRNDHSCGARCVYMILRHFGIKVLFSQVEQQCLTTEQGTNVQAILGVLRFYGLKVGHRPRMGIRGLRNTLRSGGLVLVHVDGDHFCVCYGRDRTHTWLADPNSRKKKVRNSVFHSRWSRWGLTVRKPDSV